MKKILTLILCLFTISSIVAQQVTVSGIVSDETGDPVIGCSVVIKGTMNGTATDIDGKYAITGNVGDILEFNYIGYKKKEVKIISGTTVYNVTIEQDSQQLLESVVVVGYGVAPSGKEKMLSLSPSIYDKLAEEEYTQFGENKFKLVSKEPISTFSADVDKASYSNLRRFLEKGVFPPRDAVRTEELINYFPYDYKQPTMDNPISIEGEAGICPWNKDNLLCKIGVKTRDIPTDNLPPSNFVFLIDVSGSMFGPTRLDLVKSSLSLLTDNLSDKDKVAIVVYAGSAGLVLPSTSGDKKEIIKESLNRLEAGGSTAGGEGIELAYKIAQENLIKDGNNRVIMCSDGDFNVGVTSNIGLEELIEQKRETGVFLSVLGYGMGNYKDSKMQILAQKGNGNHAYIDDIGEAKRVLVEEFAGSLYTVAKDVKLQVEFDPEKVEAYRLIGYETRLLNTEDFEDDTVDAGDMASGHTVTALYELRTKNISSPDKLLTVSMRYKDPLENTSKLLSIPISYTSNSKNSTDFNFAASVAMFSQLVRDSEYKGNVTYKDVEKLANRSLGKDNKGYRKEFVKLIKKADKLTDGNQQVVYGNVQMDNNFNTYYDDVDGESMMGMVDENDKIVVPALYDDVSYLKGGVFKTELDGKCGLYQYYSGEILSPTYDDIDELGETLLSVEIDSKYGVLDLYGNAIIPVKYDEVDITDYQYEHIIVELDDKYGLYSSEGKLLIPVSYDEIDQSYNYIILESNDKYGLANAEGKIISSVQYEEAPYDITSDLFVVSKKDKKGVINVEGKRIIPIAYDDIEVLTGDIFIVTNDEYMYGAYNSKGKQIAKTKYDGIELLDQSRSIADKDGLYGYIVVEKNDKYGLISAGGKMILPTMYDDIDTRKLDNGDIIIIAKKDDSDTFFDIKGKPVKMNILNE